MNHFTRRPYRWQKFIYDITLSQRVGIHIYSLFWKGDGYERCDVYYYQSLCNIFHVAQNLSDQAYNKDYQHFLFPHAFFFNLWTWHATLKNTTTPTKYAGAWDVNTSRMILKGFHRSIYVLTETALVSGFLKKGSMHCWPIQTFYSYTYQRMEPRWGL